jgi:hypothetical protein
MRLKGPDGSLVIFALMAYAAVLLVPAGGNDACL